MSYEKIAARYAEQASNPDVKMLSGNGGNLFVNPYDQRELLSYGQHFVLSRLMFDSDGNPAWWLLNGDRYSPSTTQHQGIVRNAVAGTGLPSMIVPFRVLREAGIDIDTIKPVDIQPERFETIHHEADDMRDVPDAYQWEAMCNRESGHCLTDGRPVSGDKFHWDTRRHWLGASVFKAEYFSHTAVYFLSAFDEQERRPLYFLAQLPDDAHPETVEQAFEDLKPQAVKDGEAEGRSITRQGDVFAISSDYGTRDLRKIGGPTQKMAKVLGVNHTASEVITTTDGRTYGRGTLRHDPGAWRTPEHRRQKMGDGKTWHYLVKNRVPEGRSWSMGGNVD